MVTEAGSLPAKRVIHAPIMEEPGTKIGAENVRRATRAALIAAHASELSSVAVPPLGADTDSISIEEASRAIVEEVRAHRRGHPETVHLVSTSAEVVAILEEALRTAQQTV